MAERPVVERPVVAVVGGGITGLSAAWTLAGGAARVVLLEAADRPGGKVLTDEVGGQPVDVGPDAFLARVPDAVDLCRAVGLGDDLVAPATGRAFIWSRGRLRPLPKGLVLGVPTALRPLAQSGLLSPWGLLRAALDRVLPPTVAVGDRSVGDLVASRLGREALDRVVDPLLGGIHAGDSRELSLATTAPQLESAAARSRSLMTALAAQGRNGQGGQNAQGGQGMAAASGPVFWSLASGLGTLVERLRVELSRRGVELRMGTAVQSLDRVGDRWRVRTPGGAVDADAVVLAVPSPVAARLVAPHAAGAAAELEGIDYASVVVTSLVYPNSGVRHPLDGSGFLVPRTEGRLMTACTWSSSKWPHLARPGRVLLRVSAGRWGDDRALAMGDGTLIDRLHTELAAALGLHARPLAVRVTRWPHAFPQYRVGHLERVARIEAGLAELPGLAVAGAAYRGVGLPACVSQGRRAAEAVLPAVARSGHGGPVAP
ncbi:MAG: protoporphyrinogen oxidase [Acidimicrobiales bacterium]|nr:MAG: protoporphyrinogen oxidase [Acidimicrobiales bacterium]